MIGLCEFQVTFVMKNKLVVHLPRAVIKGWGPVAGGRWPVAGGRWPVAGDFPQLLCVWSLATFIGK